MDNYTEEKFREVASDTVQKAKIKFEHAIDDLDSLKKCNSNSRKYALLKDNAGEGFSFAAELAIKSNHLFEDFRKSIIFNQTISQTVSSLGKKYLAPAVGSQEWYDALGGFINDKGFLSSPKDLRTKIILANDSNDERAKIRTEPQFNSTFETLSYDGTPVKTHSLYAHVQLLAPVPKSLLNTAYFCYVEDEMKYTIYALLTEDILSKNNKGNTIMPRDFMEKLDSVKNSAVDLRYSSISFRHINDGELTFLKEFSSSIIDISEHRFPEIDSYNHIDFNEFNYDNFFAKDFSLFNNLDKMNKYYLQKYFSVKEIKAFINYINILTKSGSDLTYLNIFINNAIYLKGIFINNLKINLEFTEKQFARIDNLCILLKAFQPFDSNSKRLCDNEAFSTEEQINFYIEKIRKEQKVEKESGAIDKNESIDNEKDNSNIDIHEKIDCFIEMLTDRLYTSYKNGRPDNNNIFSILNRIPFKGYESINGLNTSHFWQNNVPSIIKRLIYLEENSKTEIERIKFKIARRAIDEYKFTTSIEQRIDCFIKMLSDKQYTSYENGKPNEYNIFSRYNKIPFEGYESIDGLNTSQFWISNSKKIIERLIYLEENSKTEIERRKFKIARRAIDEYKFTTSIEQRIDCFIKMLSDKQYTSYENGKPNEYNIFSRYNKIPFEGYESIDGLNTSLFWQKNSNQIEHILFVEYKNRTEYNIARHAILTYYCVDSYEELIEKQSLTTDKMIKIYIDMLNKGNVLILKKGNNESLDGYPSVKLTNFWSRYQDRIMSLLFDTLKDDSSYIVARKTILTYYCVDSYEKLKEKEKRIKVLKDVKEIKNNVEETIIQLEQGRCHNHG